MLGMKIEELRTKRTQQNFKRKSKKSATAELAALRSNIVILKDVSMRRNLIKYQLASFVLVSDGPLNSLTKLEQMHKLGKPSLSCSLSLLTYYRSFSSPSLSFSYPPYPFSTC